MALSSHREGFSSDVSWSILTRLRQTCQNQTCQHQTCQRRFRDCAGSGIVPVHELCRVYIEQISLLDEKIGGLDTAQGKDRRGHIASHDHFWCWPDVCDTHSGFFTSNGSVCKRSGMRRLVWLLPRQKPTSGRQILCLTWPNFAGFRKWGGGIVEGY